MARHEADREDLMAEATALRERAEILIPGQSETIVAGFRANGNWSIYFGSDPVYHFDQSGALRRAFVRGDLYRSQGETLARLKRSHTDQPRTVQPLRDQTVELSRRDLEPAELGQFLGHMELVLTNFKTALDSGSATVLRQVPENEDFLPRLMVEINNALRKKLAAALTRR